jgi:hypothetical protein
MGRGSLFRKKPVEAFITETRPDAEGGELEQSIGLFQLTMFGAGATIGALSPMWSRGNTTSRNALLNALRTWMVVYSPPCRTEGTLRIQQDPEFLSRSATSGASSDLAHRVAPAWSRMNSTCCSY